LLSFLFFIYFLRIFKISIISKLNKIFVSRRLVQKTFGTRAHLVNSVDMYSLEGVIQ